MVKIILSFGLVWGLVSAMLVLLRRSSSNGWKRFLELQLLAAGTLILVLAAFSAIKLVYILLPVELFYFMELLK